MKRQRPYTDDTGLEHNGKEYQDKWDSVEEGRSEEDRERREEFKPCEECMLPTICKWAGCKKPLNSK